MKAIVFLLKITALSLLLAMPYTSASQDEGWRWQNPYLQGNALRSMVMNGLNGWAVGEKGTVMRTTNGGLDWEMVNLGTSETLMSVYMNTVSGDGWIAGANGAIFYTPDGGNTWVKQNGKTDKLLYAVSAYLGDCPWICGDDILLKSYDHGTTWEKVSCSIHSTFFDIQHKDCEEIWICGRNGLLFSTSDAGATFQTHTTSTTYNLRSLDIVPNGNYRACGNQALIICSKDGGNTWFHENQAPFIDLYNIDTRGIGGPAYAVGSKGNIFCSENGGETWTQEQSPTINELYDVCFQALYHDVYAAGRFGCILKKEDAEGAAFQVMNERPLHYMISADFTDENTGWVVGGEIIDQDGNTEGVILHTTDGGISWQKQLGIPDVFSSVDFINAQEGWAGGADGMLRHTVNGGITWAVQENPIHGTINAIHFTDENNGWMVSRDFWGEIAHTTNGGQSWTAQTNPSSNPLVDVFFINPLKGWAAGMDSTLLRTTDGGQTWVRSILNGSNNHFLRSVYFIDEMNGWTAGNQGIIMLTHDGGVTWHEIHHSFYETLNSIVFTDHQQGWAAGDAGTILRSIDGGYTWFEQYSGVGGHFLTSVNLVNNRVGWITGEGGLIMRTLNGGFRNEPGTFLRNCRNIPIPDSGEASDTLTVDISEFLSGDYLLFGVELMLDSLMHERAADLEISISHHGVTQQVVAGVNDTGADFLWTRLTDQATKRIEEGTAPFSGNHRPTAPLTAFSGLPPDGDWILGIRDTQTGISGTLKAWGVKPLYYKPLSINKPEDQGHTEHLLSARIVPNPFRESARIVWNSRIDGHTTLKICNMQGQEVATLLNRYLSRGDHALDFNATCLRPGVYFYRLQTAGCLLTGKCVIL